MGVMTRNVWVYLSIIFAFYFSCNTGFSMPRAKREAGFYTTRYGRSDPMMRFKETQTRFFPEPLPPGPELKMTQTEPMPKIACEFSIRKKSYICMPISEAPWKKLDETMLL